MVAAPLNSLEGIGKNQIDHKRQEDLTRLFIPGKSMTLFLHCKMVLKGKTSPS